MNTPIDSYLAGVPADKTSLTDDERIDHIVPLPPPEHLIRFFPIQGGPVEALIANARRSVREILSGKSDRLLVIIGPCSIHDPAAAVAYAERLRAERERHAGELEVVMRVYFEKPRTATGWKGYINDPYMDDSFHIEEGMQKAREFLLRVNELGLPAGTEALDPIAPQYLGDLITWTAIGARTSESQTHREMSSGLSTPVGFKNATDGDIVPAINAIKSAASPHSFLGINMQGRSAIVRTQGNAYGHVVLRGGDGRSNFDTVSVCMVCLLYTSPSPRDRTRSRMPSSA